MQPYSPLSTPHLLTRPNPTPVFVHLPPSTSSGLFSIPAFTLSGNWLIHLFFCDKFEFSRQVPITGEPTRRRTAFGPPLAHFWDNANFVFSRQDLLTEEKRKRKRLKTVLASGDAFEQSNTLGKWEKIKVKGLSLTSQCRHEFSYARYKMYTLPENHDWKPRKTNIAAHFMHGEKGHKKWQFRWHYIYNNRNPSFWTSTTMTLAWKPKLKNKSASPIYYLLKCNVVYHLFKTRELTTKKGFAICT